MSTTPRAASAGATRVRPAAGAWTVVPTDSRAAFVVRDKLVTTVRGTLPVDDGGITVCATGEITHGWLRVLVDGIETGNARRDRDLSKPRLLDARRFPAVTVSVGGPGTSGPSGQEGALAVGPDGCTTEATVLARGVRAPVTLTASFVEVPTGPTDVVRIRVTGRLDRRPLGIAAPSFVIGRYVDLDAELTFRHQGAGTEG